MLAIRMKRTGRSGHPQYRVIVQDSRFSPKSGRVVAYLGSYNPHTKEVSLDTEKAAAYLSNGARPSDRVTKLLKAQKVKLPAWVSTPAKKKRDVRNPEKLRRDRPAEAEQAVSAKPEEEQMEPEATAASEPEKAPEAPADDAAAESPASEEEAKETN